MRRLFGTVTYEDGRVEEWAIPAIPALAAWEDFAAPRGLPVAADEAPKVKFSLFVAWTALEVEEGFDVWRRRVVDFVSDGVEVPPTEPAAQTEPWSSSPSP